MGKDECHSWPLPGQDQLVLPGNGQLVEPFFVQNLDSAIATKKRSAFDDGSRLRFFHRRVARRFVIHSFISSRFKQAVIKAFMNLNVNLNNNYLHLEFRLI